MKVRFILDWGLEYYSFKLYDWELPFFPNIGHSIEILDIFCPGGGNEDYPNNEYLKEVWNCKFKGRGKYAGQTVSMERLLINAYSLKVININWMSDIAEVFITSDLYDKNLWDEVK